jgi:hypothetical protein
VFASLTTLATPLASMGTRTQAERGYAMVKMVLAAGTAVAFAVAGAVVLPGGEAAGQASCRPVSPATAPPARCLVMTNPDAAGLAIWGVRGGPLGGTPETEWYDYAGQPIATMGQAGGFKVYGDQICVYPPGNVFVPDACLRDDGTVTVGGQALSASDIAWLHDARSSPGRYIPGCTGGATTGGRGK